MPPPVVLVVDDDAAIRTLVTAVLRRAGYQVEPAEDGSEAVERLTSGRFDAVVLDLMMPRMNGFEVLSWIERERPETLPRVVVLTAFARAIPELERAAACKVLAKPFDLSELLAVVESCITP